MFQHSSGSITKTLIKSKNYAKGPYIPHRTLIKIHEFDDNSFTIIYCFLKHRLNKKFNNTCGILILVFIHLFPYRLHYLDYYYYDVTMTR